ncbi:MAG: universal stress protein [Gammaproteobacteria bacterium]|nr:universal stress protein [Gammaproteobacteria bacterium]
MSEKKILSVIDPTAAEQPALARAAWLAKAFGASLELFICDYDQYLAGGRFFDSKGLEKARQSLLKNHEARLHKLAQPLIAQGLTVTVDVRWAKPLDHGIVRKVTESQPVLVVKDTHYHDVLKRTVLSNTDWSLIRACPAPLLLVKPRDVAAAPTVLAAVDPMHEHDKPAELDRTILSFAKELTTAVGGQLHVLHSFDTAPVLAAASDTPGTTMSVPVAELTASMEREHREALDRLLGGYPVRPDHVHLTEGPAHQVLVETARENGVDMVVMGAVSRSGLKRIFVGSTAERTLDRLPCDLVIVKPAGFVPPELD